MKKVVLVPALLGVMGIGAVLAVAGNDNFNVAATSIQNLDNSFAQSSNNTSNPVLKLTNQPSNKTATEQVKLSIEEIEKKALQVVNGKITDLEFEKEGKMSFYEIDVLTKEAEYELILDAFSGELLDQEVDYHDDEDDYYDDIYDDDSYEDRYDDDRYDN
nr:PepSY domain-containing protein [Lysinibacillus timonensis]